MMRNRFLAAAAACVFVTMAAPATVSAQTEVVEYYALDAIGSVRVVFDANGAIRSRRDYGPFGEAITSIATDPKIYAQLFRDDESKLDYAKARMFQSRTGRFAAVDPVYAGLFNPQGWNRYSYAVNSPLTYVDPEGLNPCPVGYCESVTVKGRSEDITILLSLAGWLQDLQGLMGSGPVGRGGRTPRPTPTPTPTPTPPVPTPPAPPTGAGGGNDCQAFSSSLASLSAGVLTNHNETGLAMMTIAWMDPFKDMTSTGFKPELTAHGQGNDVYRHVVGGAGTILLLYCASNGKFAQGRTLLVSSKRMQPVWSVLALTCILASCRGELDPEIARTQNGRWDVSFRGHGQAPNIPLVFHSVDFHAQRDGEPHARSEIYSGHWLDDDFSDRCSALLWLSENVLKLTRASMRVAGTETVVISNRASQGIRWIVVRSGDAFLVLELDPGHSTSVETGRSGEQLSVTVSGQLRDGMRLPSVSTTFDGNEGPYVITVTDAGFALAQSSEVIRRPSPLSRRRAAGQLR